MPVTFDENIATKNCFDVLVQKVPTLRARRFVKTVCAWTKTSPRIRR